MQRPDPETFAHYSYILAFISAGLVTIAMVVGWLPGNLGEMLSPFQNLTWAAMITSGVGAFLAYAARADFKHKADADLEMVRRAQVGWRFNLAIFIVLLFFALLMIAIALTLGDISGVSS
jgi:hypothetical protein